MAIPARSRAFGPDIWRASIVLQITDPLARAMPDPAILADAFDLTPSEANAWGRDERFVLQLEPEGLAIFISLVAVLTAAVAGRVGRRSGT